MGRLSSDALDNEEGAIDYWGRVLDIRGEDPIALAALAELYARREMWDELVEIIDREVQVAESDEVRIVLYKRLGRIWENRLGRERNAARAWLAQGLRTQSARSGDPPHARASVSRDAGVGRAVADVAADPRAISDSGTGVDEAEIIELYAQLGELEGDVLGRVNDAVEAWGRVIALNPMDFRALGALEQLFTREARWEECIQVLERKAAVLEEPQTAIDTLLQAAAIWEEKVEDLQNAAEVYERVRAADPSNEIASAQLESIYRQLYNWEKLTEVLLERVEYTEDRHGRIDILQAVAKIYEEEVGDQESAFVVLQAGFREDYAHEAVAKELERLATAAGKWEDLLADYTEDGPGTGRPKIRTLRVTYGSRSVAGMAINLSHVDYAIHSVQQALRHEPRASGCTRRPRRLPAQARILGRANRSARAPRANRAGPGKEGRALSVSSRTCSRARSWTRCRL